MDKPEKPPNMNGDLLHLRQMLEWAVEEVKENRTRIDGLYKLILVGVISGVVGLMGIIGVLIAFVLRSG